jgi:hypothetical protein
MLTFLHLARYVVCPQHTSNHMIRANLPTINLVEAANLVANILENPLAAYDRSIKNNTSEDFKSLLNAIKNDQDDGAEIKFYLGGKLYMIAADTNGGISISNATEEPISIGSSLSDLKRRVQDNSVLAHYGTFSSGPEIEKFEETLQSPQTPLTAKTILDKSPSLVKKLNRPTSTGNWQLDNENSTIMVYQDALVDEGIGIRALMDFRAYGTWKNHKDYAVLIDPAIDKALEQPAPSNSEKAAVLAHWSVTSDLSELSINSLLENLKDNVESRLRQEKVIAYMIAEELLVRRDEFAAFNNLEKIPSFIFPKNITPSHFKSTGIQFYIQKGSKLKIDENILNTVAHALVAGAEAMQHPFPAQIAIDIYDERLKDTSVTSNKENFIRVEISAALLNDGVGAFTAMLAHELGVHSFSYTLNAKTKDNESNLFVDSIKYEAKINGMDYALQKVRGRGQSPDHFVIGIDALTVCGNLYGVEAAQYRGQMYRNTVIGMINGLESYPNWKNEREKNAAIKELLATYCLDVARIVVTNDTNDLGPIITKGTTVAMEIYLHMKATFPQELANVYINKFDMMLYAKSNLTNFAADILFGNPRARPQFTVL